MMSDTATNAADPIRQALARWRVRLAHVAMLPDLTGEPGRNLRARVDAEGRLTSGYVLMCGLSAGIAALGLLQSSTAVVIGAMLISPLMAPIAALGFGFSSIDGHRIKDAAKVVCIGALIGILTGAIVTLLSPIRNATPEIIARTQPTLLDLAIALLSGIAGGYATVQQKGGTAIGVAIATALMPPLATVGYGLGVLRLDFAFGAFLLFLTNLAAIAFSFALIARMSGAARPLRNVEWTPGYIVAGILAFAALATPLGMTLVRVSHEANARSEARRFLAAELAVPDTAITQLDVTWPLFGTPTITAVVIEQRYNERAQKNVQQELTGALGRQTTLNLQQIVAADVSSQTRAMVDAAMSRTVAGIDSDNPPYTDIQAALGLPVEAVWADRAQHVVYVRPIALVNWTLSDYRDLEQLVNAKEGDWQVNVIPPVLPELYVATDASAQPIGSVPIDVAVWAIRRWEIHNVVIAGPSAELGKADKPSPLEAALTTASISSVRDEARNSPRGQGTYKITFQIITPKARTKKTTAG